MPTTTSTPSRIDKRLGPKLPAKATYRVVLTGSRYNFTTKQHERRRWVHSTHSCIDDAVATLHSLHKPGFIQGEKRGRVRTSGGEWWLISPRPR